MASVLFLLEILFFIQNVSIKSIVLISILTILLVNIFSYFLSIYNYSKFTVMIKYYWIRVFTLIWVLEFYLFLIFTFLFIISPNELQIFWDPIRCIQIRTANIENVNVYAISLLIIFLINSSVFFKLYNLKNTYNLLLLLAVNLLLVIFIKEYKSFLYYLHISNFQKYKPLEMKKLLQKNEFYDLEVLKDLTISNFTNKIKEDNPRHHIPSIFILNIILGVKFFHVYFIIFFSLLIIYLSLTNSKFMSILNNGVISQNTTILLIFWFLNYLIYFKMYYKGMVYGPYKNIGAYELIKTLYWIKHELYLF